MRKFLKVLFALSIIVILLVIIFRERTVTIYRENEEMKIKAKEASSYIEDGWYEEPVIRIYNKDGGTLLVTEKSFAGYDKSFWADEPFISVYSETAEKVMVKESEYEEYINKFRG